MTRRVQIGLLGCGTVGSGVVRLLHARRQFLREKLGVELVLKTVCVRDRRRRRAVPLGRSRITTDPTEIVTDPSIEIVVELIGGLQPAKRWILEALRRGKAVVTANKALLADDPVLLRSTRGRWVGRLKFEASVAGGVPLIKALREGLVGNRIEALYGIINGTSNYILSAMTDLGTSFQEVLAQAQRRGYAERNAALDVDGVDAAHKLVILTFLGFGLSVRPAQVHVEGIRSITPTDVRYAGAMGYVIKPLAVAKRVGEALELRVHPALVPRRHLLASVSGVLNAIYVQGDMVGDVLLCGRGAGAFPTASAVVSDLVDLVRERGRGAGVRDGGHLVPPAGRLRVRPMRDVRTRYYLRLSAVDRPGVLAQISAILGRHRISISSLTQAERRASRTVPVIMTTHDARERDLQRAVGQIDRLPTVRGRSVVLRMEGEA